MGYIYLDIYIYTLITWEIASADGSNFVIEVMSGNIGLSWRPNIYTPTGAMYVLPEAHATAGNFYRRSSVIEVKDVGTSGGYRVSLAVT